MLSYAPWQKHRVARETQWLSRNFKIANAICQIVVGLCGLWALKTILLCTLLRLFCLASPAARIALPIQWSPHIPLAAKMATSLKALRLNVFAIYFEGLSKAQDPDHCLVHSGGGGWGMHSQINRSKKSRHHPTSIAIHSSDCGNRSILTSANSRSSIATSGLAESEDGKIQTSMLFRGASRQISLFPSLLYSGLIWFHWEDCIDFGLCGASMKLRNLPFRGFCTMEFHFFKPMTEPTHWSS